MRLTARLTATADVPARQRDAMFTLMERHYVNVRRDVFDADLAEKMWVILVSDPVGGELCGFSTQTLLAAAGAGRARRPRPGALPRRLRPAGRRHPRGSVAVPSARGAGRRHAGTSARRARAVLPRAQPRPRARRRTVLPGAADARQFHAG